MPLPLKTLQEVSAELGIPEAELKAMVQLQKIKGMLKKGRLFFAPDEIAKIKRLRKTIPDSVKESTPAPTATQPKGTPPKVSPPKAPPPRPARKFPPRPTDL